MRFNRNRNRLIGVSYFREECPKGLPLVVEFSLVSSVLTLNTVTGMSGVWKSVGGRPVIIGVGEGK